MKELGPGAFGAMIHETVCKERPLTVGTLFTTLNRLQDRGYVTSWYARNNGRLKRYFRLEDAGLAALQEYAGRTGRLLATIQRGSHDKREIA